jgi:multidrug efflux pump subunit AcrB
VPLIALADLSFGDGATSITRNDRQRMASVEADLVSGAALSQALEAINGLSVMKNLPPGIKVVPGGDAELSGELFDEFGSAISNGLMMVYVVLAILFASLLHPLTILFSLPLSITGAVLALLVTYQPITLPVVIGILMLLGIVTKNAIMLVDFAIESMHAGVDRAAAIMDAGHKRARPIVMTTIAMGAGMAPSALAVGAGGEFRSPMAIAVIGGLLVSTVLSLLFVPAFFVIMDDLGRVLLRIFGRFIGKADEPTPDRPEKPLDAGAGQRGAAEHPSTAVAQTSEPAKAG